MLGAVIINLKKKTKLYKTKQHKKKLYIFYEKFYNK